MDSYIGKLLRTNTALILLCIISIGVLFMVVREARAPTAANEVPKHMSVMSDVPDLSNPSHPIEETASAGTPASDMSMLPATSTFPSFVFAGESATSTPIGCEDVYHVVIIYPSEMDYRISPDSFAYNVAHPCTKGETSLEEISYANIHLIPGHEYYIIHAYEGNKGMWHL